MYVLMKWESERKFLIGVSAPVAAVRYLGTYLRTLEHERQLIGISERSVQTAK